MRHSTPTRATTLSPRAALREARREQTRYRQSLKSSMPPPPPRDRRAEAYAASWCRDGETPASYATRRRQSDADRERRLASLLPAGREMRRRARAIIMREALRALMPPVRAVTHRPSTTPADVRAAIPAAADPGARSKTPTA